MTKRFKLRLSKLGNGMITDTQKREDLYFDKEFLDATLPEVNEWLNTLNDENEQLKAQLKDCEKRVTDKEVEWLRNNTVWEQMPSSKKTFITTSVKEDYK